MSVDYIPKVKQRDENTPSLNISNGYAHYPAQMMGVDYNVGVLKHKDMHEALANLERVDPRVYAVGDIEGPNFINCGRTIEQVEEYRDRMIEMVEYAIRKRVDIIWF